MRSALVSFVFGSGTFVYLTRASDVRLVHWLRRTGLSRAAMALHDGREALHARIPVPSWLDGWLPDFAFAFTLAALTVKAPRAFFVAGLLLATGYEAGQACGLVPGTFDGADLASTFFAYLAVTILSHKKSS